MSLSASAIINGLTMLKAYNPDTKVSVDDERIAVRCTEQLHADDVRRLESEGWHWNDGCQEWWLT